MEALKSFAFWLGVALGSSVVLGAIIVAVLVWWFGPLEPEEGEDK